MGGRAGRGAQPLPLSVSTFQSRFAFGSAQWGWGRSTRQARPTGFPHPCPQLFLIPASLGLRRLEQAHMGHHKSRGWGQREGQCVSPLVSSRECNGGFDIPQRLPERFN